MGNFIKCTSESINNGQIDDDDNDQTENNNNDQTDDDNNDQTENNNNDQTDNDSNMDLDKLNEISELFQKYTNTFSFKILKLKRFLKQFFKIFL